MRFPRLATGLLLAFSAGVAAQPVAVSEAPLDVDVTVYRDPNRSARQGLNLRWLNGFALISERRLVRVPAGESEIRFEGVAGGIVPQSAIVTGLPEPIVERNRDALLLSPATLLDRSLGRRVHLRRTQAATGEVREQEAIVRSSAAGAVVLETESGFEALRCSGLSETIVYDEVPSGLSAKPTLSVRARSSRAAEAVVTLSYLATGLDWKADYVATLSEDESKLDLFAWLTLASSDETSFVYADTQAVAGRVNREYARRQSAQGGSLSLRCWPNGTTSDIDEEEIQVTGSRVAERAMMVPPPPPPPPPPAPAPVAAMEAKQEQLGDLKLYRIPEPVTVAANSQKQVALLQRQGIEVSLVYRHDAYGSEGVLTGQAQRVLVTRNRESEGLGLPLPAGQVRLFAQGPRPILLGEGSLDDKAVGEKIEIAVGASPSVRVEQALTERRGDRSRYRLILSNANPRPVRTEVRIRGEEAKAESGGRLERRDGLPTWSATVPANGTATLVYSIRS